MTLFEDPYELLKDVIYKLEQVVHDVGYIDTILNDDRLDHRFKDSAYNLIHHSIDLLQIVQNELVEDDPHA